MMCFKKNEEKTSVCANRKFTARVWQLLIALALLLSSAVPVAAQEYEGLTPVDRMPPEPGWTWIGRDSDRNDFSLDQRFMEDHGNYVVGRLKIRPNNAYAYIGRNYSGVHDRYKSRTSYLLQVVGGLKESKQTKVLEVILCDSYGNVVASYPQSEEWQHCPPDSMQEEIWYTLMDVAGVRY